MSIRRLPLGIALHRGEAFHSFTARLARELDIDLRTLLTSTGLLDPRHPQAIPVGYGVALTQTQVASFAAATGLPAGAVRRLLLARLDGIAVDFSDLDPFDSTSLLRVARREWVHLAGSNLCPRCLRTSGSWRLAWKLPWSFCCAEHRQLLVDLCPACGQRPTKGRRDGRAAPAYLGRVPNTTVCENQPHKRRCGGAGQPCGQPLAALAGEPLSSRSPILSAQTRLDGILAGAPIAALGEPVAPLEFFRDLRSVTALLLFCVHPDDLDHLTPATRAALQEHVASRLSAERQRAALGPRRGPRLRSYTATPRNAALMAAIVPAALSIVTASSAQDAGRLLVPHLEAAAPHRGAGWFASTYSFSPRLRAAVEHGWRRGERFSQRPWLAGAKPLQGSARWSFTARHVPQLFWREAYAAEFAPLVPPSRTETARRFCSVALVKLVDGCTWPQAAEQLGCSPTGVTQYMLRLRRAGANSFIAQLQRFADRYDEGPLTDYDARRAAFQDLPPIARADWHAICRAAAVTPGRDQRRLAATAWTWSEITGSHWRSAPAAPQTEGFRKTYKDFERNTLPLVEPNLSSYAATLLRSHGQGTHPNEA